MEISIFKTYHPCCYSTQGQSKTCCGYCKTYLMMFIGKVTTLLQNQLPHLNMTMKGSAYSYYKISFPIFY